MVDDHLALFLVAHLLHEYLDDTSELSVPLHSEQCSEQQKVCRRASLSELEQLQNSAKLLLFTENASRLCLPVQTDTHVEYFIGSLHITVTLILVFTNTNISLVLLEHEATVTSSFTAV